MGFVRDQEERLAIRLLTWQYQRMNRPLPASSDLEGLARKLVDDAHRIARERGRNVFEIIKDLIKDLMSDSKKD
jgi:hypothetical protein